MASQSASIQADGAPPSPPHSPTRRISDASNRQGVTQWASGSPPSSPTRKTSDASSLQNVTRWVTQSPILPPFSMNRKMSDASSLRNATSSLNCAPNTPNIRKIPSITSLNPVSNSLRIFKCQKRKTSLDAMLRHPSWKSLKAQFSLSTIAEPFVTEVKTTNDPLDGDAAYQDQKMGANSSVSLLLSSSDSKQDHGTGKHHNPDIKKLGTQPIESEREDYVAENRREIDLKHPTPVKKTTTEPSTPGRSCALCKTELKSTVKTYAFPQTAPAVTAAIKALHPTLETSLNNVFSPHSPTSSTPKTRSETHFRSNTPLTFCLTCFEGLHALRLCWTCGKTVYRDEERVSCGWAWWHWGCMSCLLCRAPIAPPAWTEASITLSDSPACKFCLRELKELVFLERRKMNLCRRDFSPPLTPEPGQGTGLGMGLDGSMFAKGDNYYHARQRRITRQASGSGTIIVKCRGKGRASPILPDLRNNNGIKWMTRRGQGSVGGSVRSIKTRGMNRIGEMRYPPLPKWMEKLPGQRNGSCGIKKVTEVGFK